MKRLVIIISLFIIIGSLLACSSVEPVGKITDSQEVLHIMNEYEQKFQEAQQKLIQLEQQEQEIYEQVVGKDQLDEQLREKISEVTELAKQRQKQIKKERELVEKHTKESQQYLAKLPIDKKVKLYQKQIKQRAKNHYNFVESYEQLTKEQVILYELMQEKTLTYEELTTQVERVNKERLLVERRIEKMNEEVEQFNRKLQP